MPAGGLESPFCRELSGRSSAAALLRGRTGFKQQLANAAVSSGTALGAPDDARREANRLKALILVRYI